MYATATLHLSSLRLIVIVNSYYIDRTQALLLSIYYQRSTQMIYELVSERRAPAYKVSSPSDAYKAFSRYAKARTERFLVATLNGAHEIVRVHITSIGLVNRTVVHPREVFFPAIRDNAVAIIVSHNHPSSHLDPSPEDLEISRRLREAGDILGIALLDHLIIGPKGGFYSFTEHGLLPPPSTD